MENVKDACISIIVPVYNSEKTIKQCVQSIIEQTYKNIEIILVNDGSKDRSKEICNELSLIDPRIIIINKQNGGVSSARNEGMKKAIGKYIMFVDSDDTISTKMCETLLTRAEKEKADLVVAGIDIISLRKHTEIRYKEKRYNAINELGEDAVELYQKCFFTSPVNKLYRRELVSRFPEGIHLGEDLIFNIYYLWKCQIIITLDEVLYNYLNFDENSLSNKIMPDYKRMLEEKDKIFIDFIKNNFDSKKNINELTKILFLEYLNGIVFQNLLKYDNLQKDINTIKNYCNKQQIDIENNELSWFCNNPTIKIYVILQLKLRIKNIKLTVKKIIRSINERKSGVFTLKKKHDI